MNRSLSWSASRTMPRITGMSSYSTPRPSANVISLSVMLRTNCPEYLPSAWRSSAGPFTLGYLTKDVFGGYPEPMRYAGVTMSLVFLVGLAALPFAPETKGKPLPE